MSKYEDLVKRNFGYIDVALQKKIGESTLLIAGCGLGSLLAESAARMGFRQFILADGDEVETSNLNRQAFSQRDLSRNKAESLKVRLLEINPAIEVEVVAEFLGKQNMKEIVEKADLIFDTIDFLDLEAIVELHDQACLQSKPILSAMSAGWGAGVAYFPSGSDGKTLFRQLFQLPISGSVKGFSYAQQFELFVQSIARHLEPAVIEAIGQALKTMEDGTPCPAPQVAPGAYGCACLALTYAVAILDGQDVPVAPKMVLMDPLSLMKSGGIKMI